MRPFEGIRVIDVTHVLAGPFAAYQLALLGADVIKVDDPNDPDQSRISGTDAELNRRHMGTGFLTQASNKRADHARSQDRARPRDPEKARRDRRRVRRELPARRVRGAGPRLRGPLENQSAADLCVVLGVRPHRAAPRADRLRPRHPGDLRHHGDDRQQGRAPDQVRLAGDRLCDRHERRVRALGRAVPAREDRQGPAHRHGDARCRDDPDGLAPHRLSAQRRASKAARQSPQSRDQRRVRHQGRHAGDARARATCASRSGCGPCSAVPTWRRRTTTSATRTTTAK